MQSPEARCQGIGHRLALAQVHPRRQRDGNGGHTEAHARHAAVDMDRVGHRRRSLTSFPNGMNPATQVTAARNTSGRVIVSGASCGLCAACSSRFSRPQKML